MAASRAMPLGFLLQITFPYMVDYFEPSSRRRDPFVAL